MSDPNHPSLRHWALALGVTAAAVGLRWALEPVLHLSQPLTLMYAAVTVCVWIGGYRPAIAAAVLGYLACNYLFIEPARKLVFHSPREWLGLALYLFSCAILISVGVAMRSARRRALRSESAAAREAAARLQAEDKVRDAHDNAATILESITDAYFALDRDWCFTALNVQTERYFGLPKEELISHDFWALFPEVKGSEAEIRYRRAMTTGKAEHFEFFAPLRQRWLEVHAYPTDEGLSVFYRDISPRKQAEQELAGLVQRLTTLVDNTPLAVVEWDSDFVVTRWSGQAERVFGWSAAEVVGRRIDSLAILVEEDWPKVQSTMARLLDPANKFVVSENRNRRRNGEVVYCEWYNSVLHDDTGRLVAVLSLVLDVTERTRAASALQQAEERFRVSHDVSLFGFTIMRAVREKAGKIIDFEWTYVNPAASALLRRPVDELVGRRLLQVLPNNRQSADLFDRYVRVVETGEPHDYELKYSGEGIDGWFRNMTVKLDDGVAVSFTDMTERKRVELALEKQSNRLQLLWEAAAVLLTSQTPDTLLRELFARVGQQIGVDAYFHFAVNEAQDAMKLVSSFGLPDRAALTFDRLEMETSVCGRSVLRREPIAVTRVQESTESYVRHVRALGFTAYVCNPLISGGRVLGTISFASRTRDAFEPDELEFLQTITQYMAVAHERLRLIGQLREADRRKDEFLATLGHELRNPLAPIRSAVQVLKSKAARDPDEEWSRDVIERQVAQMARLLDDLLDVSRITRGKLALRKERVALTSVITSALETSRPLIDAAGHVLTVSLPEAPLHLEADPIRLAQVFSNLLNNAAKYTERGGRIRLAARRQGDELLVTVSDSGIGIAGEMLPRLFDIFAQAEPAIERAQGGLGIGLSLVKGIVERHGGRIEVRSEGVGRGSEFIVRLPIGTAAGANGAPRPAPVARSLMGFRIVVADDHRDSAKALALLLKIKGNDVRTAADGFEAIELAETFRPDVVLLDIGMPRLNGYDTARRIRAQPWGREMFLVALTGWGSEDDRRRSQEAGCDFHLVKPVHPPDLEKLLVRLKPNEASVEDSSGQP